MKVKSKPTCISLDVVLRFLDTMAEYVKLKGSPSLAGKRRIDKQRKEVNTARRLLRSQYYAYADWCQTNKYIEPDNTTYTIVTKKANL